MRLEETAYKKTSQTSSLKERLWTRASKVEKKKYAFTCVSHVATVYTGHCIVKIEVGVGSVGLNSTKESIQEINIIKLPLENMAKRILFFEGLKELIRDTTFGVLRLSRSPKELFEAHRKSECGTFYTLVLSIVHSNSLIPSLFVYISKNFLLPKKLV